MKTRSAQLNHNFQPPLGMDCGGQQIVAIINNSKFLVLNILYV